MRIINEIGIINGFCLGFFVANTNIIGNTDDLEGFSSDEEDDIASPDMTRNDTSNKSTPPALKRFAAPNEERKGIKRVFKIKNCIFSRPEILVSY